jgi:hypothetical protein
LHKSPISVAYAALGVSAITLALLIATGLGARAWDAVSALAAVASGLVASVGLLFVGLQLKWNRRLAKAQFINDLARDIDHHSEAETNLDREGPWYEAGKTLTTKDMEKIERYITFFERVKLILDAKVLDMNMIDDLLAYRFFHLLHNPNVQEQVLFHPDMKEYFDAVLELHTDWLRYRQSRKLSIPRPDTPLPQKNPS